MNHRRQSGAGNLAGSGRMKDPAVISTGAGNSRRPAIRQMLRIKKEAGEGVESEQAKPLFGETTVEGGAPGCEACGTPL